MNAASRGLLYCGLLWALALLATACAPPEQPAEEIRLGLLIDQGTRNGPLTLQTAELALSEVNAAGGLEVGGEKHLLKLEMRETNDTPEDAARATLTLINQRRVNALVGSHVSRNAIPEAEIADAAGVPFISPGATHPQVTRGKPHAFRVSFTDAVQSRALARFAIEDLGRPPLAILYDAANAYSRDIMTTFRQVFEEAGGEVVAIETYTSGERDFRPQLRRIQQAGPAALLLPNFRSEVEFQLRQIGELGLDATLLGTDGWLPEALVDFPEAEGAFATIHWHQSLTATRPEAERFVAAFEARYDRQPPYMAALAYDAFGLLFEALQAAGTTEPAAVRDALEGIEGYRGVTGDLSFPGTEGDPVKPVVVVQIRDRQVTVYDLVTPPPAAKVLRAP